MPPEKWYYIYWISLIVLKNEFISGEHIWTFEHFIHNGVEPWLIYSLHFQFNFQIIWTIMRFVSLKHFELILYVGSDERHII